ncbi:MAG: AAA family ATPase [Rubrivivax sp.]
MAEALVVAIVGAESTGKTALAAALAERVAAETGLACTWVPEHLRQWCDTMGRTPQRHEQALIAAAQREAIEAAARTHHLVLADTTPLMTAVYSRMVFDDASLVAEAAAWQRRCALTLLTALDLPWVADGLQRDGPHVRAPVDALIREALVAHALPWSLVAGAGEARIENALDAIAPLLRARETPRRGLFTRLADRNAQDKPWSCELCDDPACEHRVRQRRPSIPG